TRVVRRGSIGVPLVSRHYRSAGRVPEASQGAPARLPCRATRPVKPARCTIRRLTPRGARAKRRDLASGGGMTIRCIGCGRAIRVPEDKAQNPRLKVKCTCGVVFALAEAMGAAEAAGRGARP